MAKYIVGVIATTEEYFVYNEIEADSDDEAADIALDTARDEAYASDATLDIVWFEEVDDAY